MSKLHLIGSTKPIPMSASDFIEYFSQFSMTQIRYYLPRAKFESMTLFKHHQYLPKMYQQLNGEFGDFVLEDLRKIWIREFQKTLREEHYDVDRPHHSRYLFHFVKRAETLQKIISDEKIKGGVGYVTGKHRVVCMTEAPLWLNQFSDQYLPYGIAVEREYFFKEGGAQVILGGANGITYESLQKIDLEHLYKPYKLPNKDFCHESEWRKEGDLELLEEIATVIVPTSAEQKRFRLETGWRNIVSLQSMGIKVEQDKITKRWAVKE
ncbi:MAG: hypothetical protein EOP04_05595 [Proteobacteria bacterium]|nr:MAG: hypothetical protein EOP04_05595 [Pseudomonadota bacterium]